MARLTDLELQVAIEAAPDAIKELEDTSDCESHDELVYTLLLVEFAKAMLEDAKEIQTLRRQNADMAAWINAHCGENA